MTDVVPALTEVDAQPGFSLSLLGAMVLFGFAQILEPSQRRFAIAVRVAGMATALLGVFVMSL